MIGNSLSYLKTGILVLYAWIRKMQSILNIAYKLKLKKWQANSEDKDVVQSSVRQGQNRNLKCVLSIDIPKPGFGITNDGYLARIFFDYSLPICCWHFSHSVPLRIWIDHIEFQIGKQNGKLESIVDTKNIFMPSLYKMSLAEAFSESF